MRIPAHERVIINWTAANRDQHAFDDPDEFAPQANREKNRVYGGGPHACPGRRISTLEIRRRTHRGSGSRVLRARDPQREAVPGGGFSYVSIVLGT
ncbi:cytochrome P450 [Actinobaculum sp. 313]|uniref:cytochrome P450 n=1 Tax=Actinobaculum sp. 313 TaxID=2495645 RepID=UPI0013DDF61B|nr:cytochrome P450 [Actinobaculum sp. 313]